MARDATPRRRSTRLSKLAKPNTNPRNTPHSNAPLSFVTERDETPENGGRPSIDNVIATPNTQEKVREQLAHLSRLSTPKTEPRPEKEQMHPQTAHQTTTKAPDSGLKLGFADIRPSKPSLESMHNTPTRPQRQSMATTQIPSTYQFKFSHGSQLSSEGQKLMDSIREDAARIKAQMQAEKELQEQKDNEAEQMFRGASGRKIARPKGKVGRFSDVHMAEFKKMASIANHPSAFRGRPSFAQPTTQSLKRSSSKAKLDELERPSSAGKQSPRKAMPTILGRPTSISPFKSIRPVSSSQEPATSAKRMRHSEAQDVSSARHQSISRPVSSSLMSPTKSSAARSNLSRIPTISPQKQTGLSRSDSVKSFKSTHSSATVTASAQSVPSPLKSSKPPATSKPLPPLPINNEASSPYQAVTSSASTKKTTATEKDGRTSRLPTFAGLKSILRSGRKASTNASRTNIPRPDKVHAQVILSPKKVDFTPSVKSRYAVKLAATSPSPAKLDRSIDTFGSAELYDPSAFVLEDDDDDEIWEDEVDQVVYPTLPVEEGPRVNTFAQKAKDLGRRESKEFKSIFTNLHPARESSSSSLTKVNTMVNTTNPTTHVNKVVQSPKSLSSKQSPNTIRQVRHSDSETFPRQDQIQTIPHGLPAEKRRHESTTSDNSGGRDDAKDNRQFSFTHTMPGAWDNTVASKENNQFSFKSAVPGAWEDTMLDENDEGNSRGGKRMRMEEGKPVFVPAKKSSAAREVAAKSAKDRKGKSPGGVLSLNRLNMLARPKHRD